MSKHGKTFEELGARLKKEFRRFADSYASAVKSGANVAGRQILNAAEDNQLPPDKLAGKLISAVKDGALHAGERLLSAGLNGFERSKEREKK